MYVPSAYQFSSPAEVLAFMRQYHFACLVSHSNSRLIATHLPFLLQAQGDELRLLSHLAKANPQAHALEQQEVLVIFSEPHAYISPTWYASAPNVPTWNYVAVHAYGQVRILDEQATYALMEQTVAHFEPQHKEVFWDKLPANYRNSLLAEVVAFELTVTRIEAQKKLSQQKGYADYSGVIQGLEHTQQPLAMEIARLMRLEWEQKNSRE